MLRAESRCRNDWVVRELNPAREAASVRVLDVGCGAGFLSNELAQHGLVVTGLDASENSLTVAKTHDPTHAATYVLGDAYSLPYSDASFSAVCAMDFLEHVAEPSLIINELARVLRPGGQFFFHTFNRNLLSYLVVIKGVEWVFRHPPRELHLLKLFIKPSELRSMCEANGLRMTTLRGFGPKINQRAFWRLLLTGIVDDDFEFEFKDSTLMGYAGLAAKL